MKSSIIAPSLTLIGCLIVSSCNKEQQEDDYPTIGEVQSLLDENSIDPLTVEFRYYDRNTKQFTHELIATNTDVEKVEVKEVDLGYKYYLVIETTDSGTEKLKNSIGKYPDNLLAIIIENELLFLPIEDAEIHSGRFSEPPPIIKPVT
ncbi:hypothetical protein P4C99_22105 [Pontiellaceae bacterium B1224]|nr:hypothetical protein [Pontiellaceae bacterium B1224]